MKFKWQNDFPLKTCWLCETPSYSDYLKLQTCCTCSCKGWFFFVFFLPFSRVTLWQRRACDWRAADTKAGPSSSLRPLHITILVYSPLLKYIYIYKKRETCLSVVLKGGCWPNPVVVYHPVFLLCLLTACGPPPQLSPAVNSPSSYVKTTQVNQKYISPPQVCNMNGVISMRML